MSRNKKKKNKNLFVHNIELIRSEYEKKKLKFILPSTRMDVKSTTISTFHINCVKEHECKIER